MNTNRKFLFSVLLALAAILFSSFSAHAYAVQPSDFDWSSASAAQSDCAQVLRDAQDTLARIDVPTTRADYAALDRIAQCLAAAEASFSIPVTGRANSYTERFMAVKDLQAELADKSGTIRSAVRGAGYLDKEFMEFKDRQAERMGR